MADTKISALTAIGALAAGDKVPVADADDLTATKSATMTQLGTYLATTGLIKTVKVTSYITGTGTHTFATGMQYCEVWCTGQGGGGGGSQSQDATSSASGSGGGAGGTAYILYNATEAGANAAYTVGTAAGAGGSNVGGNGTAGTSSTFDPAGTGATLTGTGGGLGTGVTNATPAVSRRAGGLGGTPTLGSINFIGGDGGDAVSPSIATAGIRSGYGGASYWGGGGGEVGAVSTAVAGLNGKAYGSGGGGSACMNASAGATGGNGAVGIILIKEYVA
jgi:hypothetical protein